MNPSTETAVLHVLSEIVTAANRGDFSALLLLDLSAAFDTVDHEVLFKCLDISYGVTGCALKWFQWYMCGRTQHVRLGLTKSSIVWSSTRISPWSHLVYAVHGRSGTPD